MSSSFHVCLTFKSLCDNIESRSILIANDSIRLLADACSTWNYRNANAPERHQMLRLDKFEDLSKKKCHCSLLHFHPLPAHLLRDKLDNFLRHNLSWWNLMRCWSSHTRQQASASEDRNHSMIEWVNNEIFSRVWEMWEDQRVNNNFVINVRAREVLFS